MDVAQPPDAGHMRAALAMAARGLGTTWPNPSVGAVVVREGRVVGRARTAAGGRPHAETLALAAAGEAARGATMYVTLEPCCHHGRTPPCTDALIAAGVARVVVAMRDPDPRVNGEGLARLRAAGIAVTEGVLAEAAAELVAGFARRVRVGLPLVTLKLASTLDGRIATAGGESRWITGAAARQAAHALRGRHDAVLVGIGTVLADDPDLTCRIPGLRESQPVRIIADSRLRTPPESRLAATAHAVPTWLLAQAGADAERRRTLARAGVEVIEVPAAPGGEGVDAGAALRALAERGITSVLAEGGAQLAAALLRDDLVGRLAWFHAPSVMGGDGTPAVQGFGTETLAALRRFVRERSQPMGDDMLTLLRRSE